MRFAMRKSPAAVGAAMLKRSRLEEGCHSAFAFGALHAFHIAVGEVSGIDFAAGWHGSADPYGLALVAHDGLAGGTGGGLTGYHRKCDQCEDRNLDGLKDVMFVFHD